jgi:hypothetical protein
MIVGGIDSINVTSTSQSKVPDNEGEIGAGGRGSAYLMEYYRPGMTVDEAEDGVLTAITYAAVREKATA